MKVSVLDHFIKTISATGNDGFEGLVSYLCEKATGQSFRLSGSGQQSGQDSRAEAGVGNSVKIETKRYSVAKLDSRELIAEIAQATRIDDVDLWILVASCSVLDQTAKEVEEQARSAGTEVIFIDKGISGLQRLWVLMAAYSDTVLRWIELHGIDVDPAEMQTALGKVREHVDYHDDRDALLAKLRATALGFEDAKQRINEVLKGVLASPQLSNVLFHQDWAIDADQARTVPRSTVDLQLDGWWTSLAAGALPRAVVLGEEGVGKTWSVIAWAKRILSDDTVIVVPISCAIEAIGPSDTIGTIMPRVLAARAGLHNEDFWRRRLGRWLIAAPTKSIKILIVLDGLNEKPGHQWRGFLSTFDDPRWIHSVAVLATDRPGHWGPHCAASGVAAFHEVTVDGYDDSELALALQYSSREVSDFPTALLSLVKKPRYCQLVLDHYDDLIKDSDFTVERLIYLDIQSRCATHPNFPLVGDEFVSIIKQLATQYRESSEFDRFRIADNIPWTDRERDVYEEIVSGGLMKAHSTAPGTFRVERKRLVFGLGMLLAEVVRLGVERSESRSQICETIERWFEPHPEMSLKVDIAGSAMFHSLLHKGFPPMGRQEIIRHWLGLRNWGDRAQPAFADYVRRCPEDFLAVAEGFWSSNGDKGVAQDYLARAFLKHRDDPSVQAALTLVISKWMGYVHADGPRTSWSDNEAKRRERRQENEKRAGQSLVPGPIVVHGEKLTVIEDVALLRMTRFAILLMSGGSRAPYLHAVVPWAVAGAVMGVASESREVSWLLRLADDDCNALLLDRVQALLESDSLTMVNAGHTLLHCLGSAEAKQLANQLPRPKYEYEIALQKEHQEDPCRSFMPWTDDECLKCMDRADVGLQWTIGRIGDRMMGPSFQVPGQFLQRVVESIPEPDTRPNGRYETEHDRIMDMAMPVLAGRDPKCLAEARRIAIRSLLSQYVERNDLAIMRLNNHSLILDESIVELALQVMKFMSKQASSWTDEDSPTERFAEAQLFLGVIPSLSTFRRLHTLLSRPVQALDLTTLEYWFEELPKNEASKMLSTLRSESEPRQLVRTLWYLSGHQYELDTGGTDCIAKLAQHDDWRVRAAAMQFACRAKNPVLSAHILSGDRQFLRDKPVWEMQQGTALVISSADAISIEEASKKLHPNAISYLVAKRGNTASDVAFYCEVLDRTIAKISGSSDVNRSLPAVRVPGKPHRISTDYPDFERQISDSVEWRDGTTTWTSGRDEGGQEASLAALLSSSLDDDRNQLERERVESVFAAWETDAYQWFGRRFDYDALAAICRHHGGVVERWVLPALGHTQTGRIYRSRLGTFLCFLCPGLFESRPTLALQLWGTLRNDRNSMYVFDAVSCAFRAADSPQTNVIRDELLAGAWNDAELSAIAYYAELFGRFSWLDTAVSNHLISQKLHSAAKGLTLASFSSVEITAFRDRVDSAGVADTWVAESVPILENNVQLNANAMHWYREFIEVDDWDVAWGALELTLACADERFYLWQGTIESHGSIELDRKRRFIDSHSDRIDKKLNQTETRAKTLFGRKISENELLPFIHF